MSPLSRPILLGRKTIPQLSGDQLRIFVSRIKEKLWVKPLLTALLSIAAAFGSTLADTLPFADDLPKVSADSVQTLLSVMASSMLAIATFAVASMVSAYASASSAATPRSFTLVVSDDVSQNALSTFIGSFIFSIVALSAVTNEYFGQAGLFCLFALTIAVFGLVILTFVRWVDRIARLGRLGETVDKVEKATSAALSRRRVAPTLRCQSWDTGQPKGTPLFSPRIAYVQHIDMENLQSWAKENDARITVCALPGTFMTPERPLAYIDFESDKTELEDNEKLLKHFTLGDDRLFDDDPRFGLIVLSEIAGKALSPAVNDPGTAIDVLGTLIRLFEQWSKPLSEDEETEVEFDRIAIPTLSTRDMFDDAFTSLARDGARAVELAVRLQKALRSLAQVNYGRMREAANHHGRLALQRAERALEIEHDIELVRAAARWLPADVTDNTDQ